MSDDRLERVRARMVEHGVDVLVLRPSSNLRYLARSVRHGFLVITPDGPPAHVPDASPLIPAGSRVAVDPQMLAHELLSIQERLGPQTLFASAEPLLAALRMRKSGAEIAALERAAVAADRAVASAAELSWSGATEREMARLLRRLLLEAGHDEVTLVTVAAGEHSADPYHRPTERTINPGDAVLVNIGGRYEDYCSDIARMFVVAEPPEDFEAMYSVVLAVHGAACEAVRPGVTAAEIDEVCRDAIAASGYGSFFAHRTGHGVGLDQFEPPYLSPGDRTVIEPGMTMSIQPAIYLPGLYGARIEDVVVCTDVGARRLNQSPRLLIVTDR
ncbi:MULTISPECIES: M24 family metallopeptidase [unclassified Actinomadura]|uniref:M24 family metallopeptidase n=1 Tax=unclassified Actinomadura TaxID=2626254 RepID=UPI0011EE1209|nr:M24 family metallopeptidase [Actinomadura sp. K4S16]